MTCTCNYICSRFKDTGIRIGGAGYINNKKRCRRCNYTIITTNLRCECCHGLFKTKRTNGRTVENDKKLIRI